MTIRIVLLTLLFAGAAHAQLDHIRVTTVPAIPNAHTAVRIVVTTECGCPGHLTPIMRNGNTFDIPANPLCPSACGQPDVATYDVGVLEPGVYTVRHYFVGEPSAPFEVIGSFAVVEGSVPALGWPGMVALAVGLVAVAWFVLRR